MAKPFYTITAALDQELNDWVERQPENRNALVKKALNCLREHTALNPEDPAIDPYSYFRVFLWGGNGNPLPEDAPQEAGGNPIWDALFRTAE